MMSLFIFMKQLGIGGDIEREILVKCTGLGFGSPWTAWDTHIRNGAPGSIRLLFPPYVSKWPKGCSHQCSCWSWVDNDFLVDEG